MHPDDQFTRPLTGAELRGLVAHLVENGHREVAVDILARTAFDGAFAALAGAASAR